MLPWMNDPWLGKAAFCCIVLDEKNIASPLPLLELVKSNEDAVVAWTLLSRNVFKDEIYVYLVSSALCR